MNNLIADILRSLHFNPSLSSALMVVDYILCTTLISPGEEEEILVHIVDINQLLRKDWHLVFDDEIVALALEGKVKTKTGEVVNKGVAVTHKQLCNKRASLYREMEPSLCDIAEGIRPKLLVTTSELTASV